MTKKDYGMITKVLAKRGGLIGKEGLVKELARIFKEDNPHFDTKEFIMACFTEEGG